MEIILLIIFVLAVLLLGIFLGFILSKDKVKNKISAGLAFGIVSLVSFVLGVFAIMAAQFLWNKAMIKEVKLVRDIDFSKNNVLKDDESYKPKVFGNVKKGSVGKQSFRKGEIVLIEFPVVLREENVEYIEE